MSEPQGEPLLFDLSEYLSFLRGGGWKAGVRKCLDWCFGFSQIRAISERLDVRAEAGERPFVAFVDELGLKIDEHGVSEAIPREGGLLVVANHPFGGVDAISLPALVTTVRDDVKVIANAEMVRMKSLAPLLLPMEIMVSEGASRRNVATLRSALEHLRSGGVVVMFPAGAVSRWSWDRGRVEEPAWSEHAARLLLKAKVPVLPVGFSGRNPAWFHFLGALHPLLRGALIPRVLLTRRGQEIACFSGQLFTPDDFPPTAGELTQALRCRVEKVLELAGN